MTPVLLLAKLSVVMGSLLLNTIFNYAANPITPVTGGAIMVPEFTATGTPTAARKAPLLVPFNAYATATGSSTVKVNGGVKYAAFCIPSPLTKMSPSHGSGAPVLAWSFQMGPNPQGAAYDITFEKSCNSGTGGQMIVNNLSLATGATLTLSGSRLPQNWNGADFIKGATTTNLTNTTTSLRLRGFLMDIHGE